MSDQFAPQQPGVGPLPGPAAGQVWIDHGPLDTDWDPPTWHDRLPLRLKVLALVVALALLVGLAWLVGGFKPEATVKPVDWRTPVVAGPVELTLERALFEPGSEYRDPRIIIEARCRLAVESATRVQTSSVRDGLAVRVDGQTISGSRELYVAFGANNSAATNRFELSPGVEPTPCYIQATLPANSAPTATVQLLVFNQQYVERGFVAAGEKQWVVVRGGALMTLPVSVVPER
ncbi:hypothetical protein ACPCG0_09640 [Propionibacteriaceae bacterium Y1923]|uniref:hypothetical protein n=1 Tax=Aestuariimicrobium sp. Y1814 TaxID=3418742 RepID=UPI003C14F262